MEVMKLYMAGDVSLRATVQRVKIVQDAKIAHIMEDLVACVENNF